MNKTISIYDLEYFQQGQTETHYILRVPGGWIYTDRRGDSAVGCFVPFTHIEHC